MQVEFGWYIPAAGDGRYLCTRQPERLPTHEYLTQVARAAEYAGFDSVLVPVAFSNGNYSIWAPRMDAWTVGTAALLATRRLQVIIAHRPGFINPAVFAQMATTLDEMAQGRLALNIVTAGSPGDMEQYGDYLDHDARYHRAEEFVHLLKLLWTQPTTTYNGVYYRMQSARLEPKPVQPAGPQFYLAGASEAALRMAGQQADVYMMSADTVDQVARRVADVREHTPAGRTVRFCVAGTVFCRETEEAARAWAHEFVEHADLEVLAERKAAGRQTQSVEDVRFRAGTNVDTWLSPTLWSGMSHLAYGAAWVGSYETLADLFVQYVQAGISVFQLYGYPFLEEAYQVGENFMPVVKQQLARQGLLELRPVAAAS